MGYEVHITRKSDWFAEEGAEITLQEWLACVESDPDMRLDDAAEAVNADGETIRFERPGIAVWTAYRGHGEGGNMAWFCHFDDRITVKNPDLEILAKMHHLSRALGAKVQGDDGEIYDAFGDSDWQEPVSDSPAKPSIKPWWKFWG